MNDREMASRALHSCCYYGYRDGDLAEINRDIDIISALLAAARLDGVRLGLEAAAKTCDPPPGPEPRDFTAHRETQATRQWLASCIRSLDAAAVAKEKR